MNEETWRFLTEAIVIRQKNEKQQHNGNVNI